MSQENHLILSSSQGYFSECKEGLGDFYRSFARFRLARTLAYQDILGKYRGSILGPFWITITTAALTAGLGVLYSNIFGAGVRNYVPFIAIGLVVWSFIASTITEGTNAFNDAAGILRQTSLPVPLFLLRVTLRNCIVLMHQLIILVAVFAYFRLPLGVESLMSLLGLALMTINLAWIAMLVAIASSRFRDVPQVVTALMQFALFMTPVFWSPEKVAGHPLVTLNPFYYMLDAVRTPLLGHALDPRTLTVVLTMAVVGWAITLLTYAATRRRVVHYL
ncbi:ABC transporter permease [Caulobacter endophyticus]|nr:ABC transporter permease [Caulobacter endophyticus]